MSLETEFQVYNLGDVNVIELLLSLRYKYDAKLFEGDELTPVLATGDNSFKEEIITTYLVLDEYIKKSKLTPIQTKIIDMVNEGYNYDEIGFELDIDSTGIGNRLKTACRKIKKVNDREWRKSVYTNKLGLKTKSCSKCKEELPATSEFFGDLRHSRDGFHSQCRLCKE